MVRTPRIAELSKDVNVLLCQFVHLGPAEANSAADFTDLPELEGVWLTPDRDR